MERSKLFKRILTYLDDFIEAYFIFSGSCYVPVYPTQGVKTKKSILELDYLACGVFIERSRTK